MQLFTIGVEVLEIDGTVVVDELGHPVNTYDSDDVMSFARVWTGFQPSYSWNKQDSMSINQNLRDWWPKRGLKSKYIGDLYPLCVDLPDRSFMRIGAKYVLQDADWIEGNEHHKRVVLDKSLDLYKKLCNPNPDGSCDYPSVVILDENLECNNTESFECQVETLTKTIQLEPGIFYSYEQVPCVQLAVYPGADGNF